jgi:glutaredoxin 3
MDKTVTIYSTPVCHFCHMAKEFFQENNIAYTEHDVASPVIVIGDDLIIGFDEPKVKEILGM